MQPKNINQNLRLYGEYRAVVHNRDGSTASDEIRRNLITTRALNFVCRQLAGTNTNELQLRHLAVGTGSVAPATSDLKMSFESVRETVSSAAVLGAQATVAAFFSAGDFVGTIREFGAFGDGGDTASIYLKDRGMLFSRVATVTTVSADQTLTLTYRVTAQEG